jgi:hypothetical protein
MNQLRTTRYFLCAAFLTLLPTDAVFGGIFFHHRAYVVAVPSNSARATAAGSTTSDITDLTNLFVTDVVPIFQRWAANRRQFLLQQRANPSSTDLSTVTANLNTITQQLTTINSTLTKRFDAVDTSLNAIKTKLGIPLDQTQPQPPPTPTPQSSKFTFFVVAKDDANLSPVEGKVSRDMGSFMRPIGQFQLLSQADPTELEKPFLALATTQVPGYFLYDNVNKKVVSGVSGTLPATPADVAKFLSDLKTTVSTTINSKVQ